MDGPTEAEDGAGQTSLALDDSLEERLLLAEDEGQNEGPGNEPQEPRPTETGASTLLLLPMMAGFMLQQLLVMALLPGIQASWFTKCDLKTTEEGACKPDYEAAQAIGGAVDSTRNLFAFFSAALVGRLSDVLGRRPVLLGLLTVSALPTFALVVTGAESATAYYSASVIAGVLGVGSTSTFLLSLGNAYVADTYAPADRPAQFGLVMGVTLGCLAFNPVVSVFTKQMDVTQVCLVSQSGLLAVILYVAFVLPESLPPERRNAFSCGTTLNPLAPLRLLAQSRILRWIALVYFLSNACELGVKEIALPYVDQVLGLEGAEARAFNSNLFGVLGAAMLLSNLVWLRALLACGLRSTSLFALGQMFSCVHVLVYAVLQYAPYQWIIFLNALPTSFISLSNVASSFLISANMNAHEQGFALGTLAAVAGVADVLSPLLYSELFAFFGKKYDLPMVPFIVGALCAALSAVLSLVGPLRTLDRAAKLPQPSDAVVPDAVTTL